MNEFTLLRTIESHHQNKTISQLAICPSYNSTSHSYSKPSTNPITVLPSVCTMLHYMLMHNCSFSLSMYNIMNMATGVSVAHTKTVIHSNQCYYTILCYQAHINIHTHCTNYLQPAVITLFHVTKHTSTYTPIALITFSLLLLHYSMLPSTHQHTHPLH
jgi:hypothetical protein